MKTRGNFGSQLENINATPCVFRTKNKEGENIAFNLQIKRVSDKIIYIDCLSNDGQTMGSVEFYIKGKEAYLFFICTDIPFQHKGVASALIETMEYVACKNGATYVEGKYYPMNKAALPFYKKHGYFVPNQDKSWETYDETWTLSKELDYDMVIQKGNNSIVFGKNAEQFEEKEIEM